METPEETPLAIAHQALRQYDEDGDIETLDAALRRASELANRIRAKLFEELLGDVPDPVPLSETESE